MAGKESNKVIDVFAGPGGLGEGFAALGFSTGKPSFRLALSIEKDPTAHSTLMLRSFYRQFDPEKKHRRNTGLMPRVSLPRRSYLNFILGKPRLLLQRRSASNLVRPRSMR